MRETARISILILCLLCIMQASAFEIREGDSITISEPVDDDLLISGGTVTINAPVRSLTFAGGTLVVNAPVKENLIAAGGEIQVNGPVGTDAIAAGGRIDLNGDVGGKILAAGGAVTMNGKTRNFAVSGGKVVMGSSSHVSGDAIIGSSDYTPGGMVEGKITTETHDTPDTTEKVGDLLSFLFTVIQILFAIGMLILGIILILLIPGPVTRVTSALSTEPLLSLIIGIASLIIAGILSLILLVTIIGIPLAVMIALVTLIGLMLSSLITGAALGSLIAEKSQRPLSPLISFVIGFIILQILIFIPILGFFVNMAAVFLGLGALVRSAAVCIRQPAIPL